MYLQRVYTTVEFVQHQNKPLGAKIQNVATNEISKTQIDRLGERLKKGDISDNDLRLLDKYRHSFSEPYGIVAGRICEGIKLEVTGRLVKSTKSISDKLRRESVRLTQIQDIAGCRLIVPDIAIQEVTIKSLQELFENTVVVDRRKQPSHGYRAVHVIVYCLGKTVEIQIRTSLQHLWAELSEKFSDVVDPAIKYGGGDKAIQDVLSKTSASVAVLELLEYEFSKVTTQLSLQEGFPDQRKRSLVNQQEKVNEARETTFQTLHWMIDNVSAFKGGASNVISD